MVVDFTIKYCDEVDSGIRYVFRMLSIANKSLLFYKS